MQLLRDNLTLWTSDMQDTGKWHELGDEIVTLTPAAEDVKKEDEAKDEAPAA